MACESAKAPEWVNQTCRRVGVSKGRDVFVGNGKVVIIENMARYGEVDALVIEYPMADVILHISGRDVRLTVNRLQT